MAARITFPEPEHSGRGLYLTKSADGFTWDDNSPMASSRNALIEAGMHRMLQFVFLFVDEDVNAVFVAHVALL